MGRLPSQGTMNAPDAGWAEFSRTFAECHSAQAPPQVQDGLKKIWTSARSERSALSVRPEDFARHLAARLEGAVDLLDALDALHAGDLYLALGCALGDAAALQAFRDELLPR